MALLAEELVEEWLNRQGYFTIRGVKVGVDEIDLLAVRFNANKDVECRHIEVQASMRPISYISRIPKNLLKQGQSATSASKRDLDVLEAGVKEWVFKKFLKPKKIEVMQGLFPTSWTSELVVNVVKWEEELEAIKNEGITVIPLSKVISDLNNTNFKIQSAAGADFADLIHLASRNT